MDTTKDIVDTHQNEEENNNVDVATTEQPNINNNNTSNTSSGLQQIEDDDNNDLPLPMGMAEVISNRAEPPKQIGKVEQLVDDDTGPEPPAAMLEASFNAADIVNKITASSKTPINKLNSPLATALKGRASDMNSSSKFTVDLTEALQSGRINLKEVEDIINSFKDTSANAMEHTDHVNELNPPVPFNSANYEDDAIAKKKAKDEMNQKPAAEEVVLPSSDRDSIYEPSRELIEGSEGMSDNTNTGRGGTNRRGWDDIESRVACRDIESQQRRPDNYDSGGSINNDSMLDTEDNVPTFTNQVLIQGLPELEAYLVEDVEEEVFIATPTLPWWKQRRTKILLGVVLVIVATLSIVLGVELSRPNSTVNMIVNSTNAPTVSLAPTSSMAPSSSPTKCVDKIISNKQEIDLQNDILIDDPRDVDVAIDGNNMVIVAKDGKYYGNATGWIDGRYYDGPAFIVFYSLGDDDQWQRVQTSRVDGLSGQPFSIVALYGTTAFIAFPDANEQGSLTLVYEQNEFEEWERFEDPFILDSNASDYRFGLGIDISRDLACIGSSGEDDYYMNMFHRDGEKWVQFDIIEADECSISGDIISILNTGVYIGESPAYPYGRVDVLQLYRYHQDLNEAIPIQEPIYHPYFGNVNAAMDLSDDYLVYWESYDCCAFIYHRNEANYTYTLNQMLNITNPEYSTYASLALDKDVMVAKGFNGTLIFSLTSYNDSMTSAWDKSITLNNTYSYQLSGRTLIGTKENEVYAFNIQTCTQDTPTQAPTISTLPTISPSSYPSVSPTAIPSLAPSLSIFPTEVCNWISINVLSPRMNDWTLSTINNTREESFVTRDTVKLLVGGKVYSPSSFSSLTSETHVTGTLCDCGLEMSQCECKDKVCLIEIATMSDIEKEANCILVGGLASIHYQIFLQDTSYPSISIGSLPSVDISKEDGRYLLANEVGKLVKMTKLDAKDLNSHLCLQDGEYNFTFISDSYSNDLSNYTVKTQDGSLIAGGVEFVKSESTLFSMPFVPAPSMNPSSSLEPSSTSSPSISSSSSLAPTLSLSPTMLHCIDIVYDGYPTDTSWSLQQLGSDNELVETHLVSDDEDSLYTKNICLHEGEYDFVINDSSCGSSNGHYNVTTSNGTLIAIGGSVHWVLGEGCSELTSFSIPYSALNCIEISIIYDWYPSQTSWDLYRVLESGNEFVKSHYTSYYGGSDTSHIDIICLQEGEYDFTIYDSFGDGMCCGENGDGHYKLALSNGVLIAEGGDFRESENTLFTIPFIPGYPSTSPTPQTPITPYPTEADSSPHDESSALTTTSPQSVPASDSSPPVASPDSVSVSDGDEVFVSVLDNDTPSASQTLSINDITTQASNGDCSISIDLQEVIYNSNPGFTGFDSCVYDACDSALACDTATLTVIVMGK